jgi:RHS repeat-associated protein
MTSQSLLKGAETLQRYDYTYGQIDQNDNLNPTKNNGQLAQVESYIGTAKQFTKKFSYDSIGRLSKEEELRGDNSALTYRSQFDYDRFGNLYRKQANNTNSLSYSPIEDGEIDKSTNRFTSNTQYDDAGNVTSDYKFRSMSYSYDANGRMVRTSTVSNTNQASSVYDASGNRVATKVGGVWTHQIYDIGGKLVAEYSQNYPSGGGVKYILQDWQGSSRAIVGSTGTVQSRMDYTAFGEEINSGVGQRTTAQGFNATNNLNQKYALTERDKATGLDHTWWRKNENKAGRWTSPDPYSGSAELGDPQSFNRYSYVGNDPTNFVDPSGLFMAPPPVVGVVTITATDTPINWDLWWRSIWGNNGIGTTIYPVTGGVDGGVVGVVTVTPDDDKDKHLGACIQNAISAFYRWVGNSSRERLDSISAAAHSLVYSTWGLPALSPPGIAERATGRRQADAYTEGNHANGCRLRN